MQEKKEEEKVKDKMLLFGSLFVENMRE